MAERKSVRKRARSWLQKDYIIITSVIVLFLPFIVFFAFKLYDSATSSSIGWGINAMVQSLAAILGIQFILITILWTQASSSIDYLNTERIEFCRLFWELKDDDGTYHLIDRIRASYGKLLEKDIEEGEGALRKIEESEVGFPGKGLVYETKREIYVDLLLLCEDANSRGGLLLESSQVIAREANELGVFHQREEDLTYAQLEDREDANPLGSAHNIPEHYQAYSRQLNELKKSSVVFFEKVMSLFSYDNNEIMRIELAKRAISLVQNKLDESNIETHLHKIKSLEFFKGSLSILTVIVYVMSMISLTFFLIGTTDIYINRFALSLSFVFFILPISLSVLMVTRFLRLDL